MDFDFGSVSSSIDQFFDDKPKKRVASSGKIRISSTRDLIGFSHVASDKLIHISQQDFWKIGTDSEGHYIERLVNDDDGPIKG